MMGLMSGNMYVLFLSGPERMAGWPAGSFMLWSLEGTEVTLELDKIRALKGKRL
jgi:hypothetical protein